MPERTHTPAVNTTLTRPRRSSSKAVQSSRHAAAQSSAPDGVVKVCTRWHTDHEWLQNFSRKPPVLPGCASPEPLLPIHTPPYHTMNRTDHSTRTAPDAHHRSIHRTNSSNTKTSTAKPHASASSTNPRNNSNNNNNNNNKSNTSNADRTNNINSNNNNTTRRRRRHRRWVKKDKVEWALDVLQRYQDGRTGYDGQGERQTPIVQLSDETLTSMMRHYVSDLESTPYSTMTRSLSLSPTHTRSCRERSRPPSEASATRVKRTQPASSSSSSSPSSLGDDAAPWRSALYRGGRLAIHYKGPDNVVSRSASVMDPLVVRRTHVSKAALPASCVHASLDTASGVAPHDEGGLVSRRPRPLCVRQAAEMTRPPEADAGSGIRHDGGDGKGAKGDDGVRSVNYAQGNVSDDSDKTFIQYSSYNNHNNTSGIDDHTSINNNRQLSTLRSNDPEPLRVAYAMADWSAPSPVRSISLRGSRLSASTTEQSEANSSDDYYTPSCTWSPLGKALFDTDGVLHAARWPASQLRAGHPSLPSGGPCEDSMSLQSALLALPKRPSQPRACRQDNQHHRNSTNHDNTHHHGNKSNSKHVKYVVHEYTSRSNSSNSAMTHMTSPPRAAPPHPFSASTAHAASAVTCPMSMTPTPAVIMSTMGAFGNGAARDDRVHPYMVTQHARDAVSLRLRRSCNVHNYHTHPIASDGIHHNNHHHTNSNHYHHDHHDDHTHSNNNDNNDNNYYNDDNHDNDDDKDDDGVYTNVLAERDAIAAAAARTAQMLQHHFRPDTNTFAPFADYELDDLFDNFVTLCDALTRRLRRRSCAILRLTSPIFCASDVEGSFADLDVIRCRMMPFGHWHLLTQPMLFLGNYVHAGPYDVQVVMLLFAWAVLRPCHVHLLRGPHEDSAVNAHPTRSGYPSFVQQCVQFFGNNSSSSSSSSGTRGYVFWRRSNAVFALLPVAATINNAIFACHGGVPMIAEDAFAAASCYTAAAATSSSLSPNVVYPSSSCQEEKETKAARDWSSDESALLLHEEENNITTTTTTATTNQSNNSTTTSSRHTTRHMSAHVSPCVMFMQDKLAPVSWMDSHASRDSLSRRHRSGPHAAQADIHNQRSVTASTLSSSTDSFSCGRPHRQDGSHTHSLRPHCRDGTCMKHRHEKAKDNDIRPSPMPHRTGDRSNDANTAHNHTTGVSPCTHAHRHAHHGEGDETTPCTADGSRAKQRGVHRSSSSSASSSTASASASASSSSLSVRTASVSGTRAVGVMLELPVHCTGESASSAPRLYLPLHLLTRCIARARVLEELLLNTSDVERFFFDTLTLQEGDDVLSAARRRLVRELVSNEPYTVSTSSSPAHVRRRCTHAQSRVHDCHGMQYKPGARGETRGMHRRAAQQQRPSMYPFGFTSGGFRCHAQCWDYTSPVHEFNEAAFDRFMTRFHFALMLRGRKTTTTTTTTRADAAAVCVDFHERLVTLCSHGEETEGCAGGCVVTRESEVRFVTWCSPRSEVAADYVSQSVGDAAPRRRCDAPESEGNVVSARARRDGVWYTDAVSMDSPRCPCNTAVRASLD